MRARGQRTGFCSPWSAPAVAGAAQHGRCRTGPEHSEPQPVGLGLLAKAGPPTPEPLTIYLYLYVNDSTLFCLVVCSCWLVLICCERKKYY